MDLKVKVINNANSNKKITEFLLFLLSKYNKNILSSTVSFNNKIDTSINNLNNKHI